MMNTQERIDQLDHAHYSIDGQTCETCGVTVYQTPKVPPVRAAIALAKGETV